MDWAGIVVERISGLALNAYFQKYIFEPLGIKDMTMFPSKDMKDRLAYMHTRAPDGMIRARDHLFRIPLVIDPDNVTETRRVFNSGGAGLFGTPQEYCSKPTPCFKDPSSRHITASNQGNQRYWQFC